MDFLTDVMESSSRSHWGKSSEQALKVKTIFRNAFDNEFSYRFMTHYRNYSQHIAMPVHKVNMDKEGDKKHELAIFVNLSDFISRYNWDTKGKKKLKTEISNLGKEVNIILIISELTAVIKSVEQSLLDYKNSNLIVSCKYISNYKNEIPPDKIGAISKTEKDGKYVKLT